MGTPYMGELKLISWDFAPQGWALANGQFLPINQNQALFSLFGTQFGGNGQTTFALPDLRGRTPIHMGPQNIIGTKGGEESHTLTLSEMPSHNHFVSANNANGNNVQPAAHAFASFLNGYRGFDSLTTLQPPTLTNVGGSQPHENRQPFLVLNVIVALQGVFPSRN